MIKKGCTAINKTMYKVAEKVPYPVLALGAGILVALVYNKGTSDVVKNVNECAKKNGMDLTIEVV